MTAAQYRAACHSLGLSPGYGAAFAIGKSVATVVRYANGTTPIPKVVSELLIARLEIVELERRNSVLEDLIHQFRQKVEEMSDEAPLSKPECLFSYCRHWDEPQLCATQCQHQRRCGP